MNAGLDHAYAEAQLYVARQLGWLEAGEGLEDLQRRLRGRGGRRALLDRIVRVEKPHGARRSGLSDPSAVQRCKEWVTHLATPSLLGGLDVARGTEVFRRHLSATLEGLPSSSRDDLRLSPKTRRRVFQDLENAVREILPDISAGRRRSGLPKRALAALAGRSVESLAKALRRPPPAAQRPASGGRYVELQVDPPLLQTEGRILVDSNLLEKNKPGAKKDLCRSRR